MTYEAFSPRDVAPFARNRRRNTPTPPAVLCAVTLLLGASVGLTLFYRNPTTTPQVAGSSIESPVAESSGVQSRVSPGAGEAAPPPLAQASQAPEPAAAAPYDALLDPTSADGYRAVTFARSIPLRGSFTSQPAPHALPLAHPLPSSRPAILAELPPEKDLSIADVPMPAPRPAFIDPIAASPLAPSPIPSPLAHARVPLAKNPAVRIPAARLPAARIPSKTGSRTQTAKLLPPSPAEAPAKPSLLETILGLDQPSDVLPYAPADDGLRGAARVVQPDRWTAVYNIATHTVTLPNGTRLEAHSGLGSSKDDPSSVTQRMRGATPPAIYELQPREALFHGVAALRLNPIGGTTFGRGGLLAHTYMLGPRGDSNGCVVFRDYAAFRRAYDNGDIRRLVVIAGRD